MHLLTYDNFEGSEKMYEANLRYWCLKQSIVVIFCTTVSDREGGKDVTSQGADYTACVYLPYRVASRR